ncbi:AAA family ATPase [Cloacibacillus evryensis]|uniref:AAA family ATPase n=1 Tax=Cloacibacillus evryensis TaxID=508460 RepID=UPI0022DFA1EB|nr:AAA family ATPase [Cloacibacillus evryensis]
MSYSPSLDDMRSWVQDAFPGGKWKDASKIEWLCAIRDEKTPSCYVNIAKRTFCDFGGASGKLSELCEQQGIPDPYRKEDDFHTRQTYTPTATVDADVIRINDRWERATPASSDFPYLKNKRVSSLGLREDLDPKMGRVLLIPARSPEGVIRGLERITPEGQKMHLGAKSSVYHLIGNLAEGEKVLVSEGFATGASLYLISGYPVAVSFGSNNLFAVAQLLRDKKNCTPVVCPDADSAGARVTEESLKAGVQVIQMPEGSPKGWDWNDLLLKHGLDEAQRIFRQQEQNSPTCAEAKEKKGTFCIRKMGARELYQTPLASPTWAIDQMIPQGLSVIASPPKTGKSYFVLQSAFAVASGEKFLGYRTTKGKVLLISLEDTFNRLQKRIVQVCPDTSKIPDNLDMTVEFPRLDSEGLACLDKQIKESGYSLVIVDTWGKSKPNGQAKRSENVYETDVRLVSEVKKLADKYGISILLVHHLKKGGGASKDWLESLSGSMGLSATVDGLLALERERGSDIGILKRSGRDLEDDEDIGLNWLAPCWEFNGSAVQMKLNATKQKILTCIEKSNEPVKPCYVSTDTGINANTVRYHLSKMLQEGLIAITSDGKYMLPPKKEIIDGDDDDVFTNSTNSTNTANSTNSPNSTNSTNSCDFTKTNRMTNSRRDGDTKDSKPPVCPVGLVGHIEGDSTSSGAPTEFEEIIIDTSFNKQEYDEAQAQRWLETAPEEVQEAYRQRVKLYSTSPSMAKSGQALRKTWEAFHRQEVA